MHQCPECGKETSGSWSEGGLKWALCEDCMDWKEKQARRERECDRQRISRSAPGGSD